MTKRVCGGGGRKGSVWERGQKMKPWGWGRLLAWMMSTHRTRKQNTKSLGKAGEGHRSCNEYRHVAWNLCYKILRTEFSGKNARKGFGSKEKNQAGCYQHHTRGRAGDAQISHCWWELEGSLLSGEPGRSWVKKRKVWGTVADNWPLLVQTVSREGGRVGSFEKEARTVLYRALGLPDLYHLLSQPPEDPENNYTKITSMGWESPGPRLVHSPPAHEDQTWNTRLSREDDNEKSERRTALRIPRGLSHSPVTVPAAAREAKG